MQPFREKVVAFGPDRRLIGILTAPVAPRLPGSPHVVLLNSGLIHRVGTSRLHVLLARDLAAGGIATLRFDLSGIGDSERQPEAITLQQSVEQDISAALAFLSAEHGAGHFVLAGLCSGAYDAFHAAQEDPRISSVVLLDIPGPFLSWRHVVHHLKARVLRSASWRRPIDKLLLYARVLRHVSRPGPGPTEIGYRPGVRRSMSREHMQSALEEILGRNVHLYFIFTAGVPGNYNHRSQFRRAFPAAAEHSALKHDFLPECDHLFSSSAARARVVSLIREWVASQTVRLAALLVASSDVVSLLT
ncbi:MAG: hypothetical protein H6Q77_2149 [Gemmatimonadetes bacterium]|nr:hypothetical protein [Gemmatimonadota bacterium]